MGGAHSGALRIVRCHPGHKQSPLPRHCQLFPFSTRPPGGQATCPWAQVPVPTFSGFFLRLPLPPAGQFSSPERALNTQSPSLAPQGHLSPSASHLRP